MEKKKVEFSSFEDSENEQLLQNLKMTISERFEMLELLQKMKYELDESNPDFKFDSSLLEEPQASYIVLQKKV